MIYWHPAVNVNWRLMKIYWWMNRMQKRQRNIIFFNWNFFINTIIHCQTSFPFFEWKLGVSWAPLISLKMASYVHGNSSLKIFEHENMVLCTYHRHLFFNFKQLDHHWKLLKTLDFNAYQGFLFLFFIQLFLVILMNLYVK